MKRGGSGSLVVLGASETVHWVSLAVMHSLRAWGCRVTGLMPLARDAQWQGRQWRSARVEQLKEASSIAFPVPALCGVPQPHAADVLLPELFTEAVVDSYAVLSTWADVVVVDGVGPPQEPLAPGLNMVGVAQALNLPVLIACDNSEEGLTASCELVRHLRDLNLRLLGWVQAGQRRLPCSAGIECMGAVPESDLEQPQRAFRYIDAPGLMAALGLRQELLTGSGIANARKTWGQLH